MCCAIASQIFEIEGDSAEILSLKFEAWKWSWWSLGSQGRRVDKVSDCFITSSLLLYPIASHWLSSRPTFMFPKNLDGHMAFQLLFES